MCDGEQWVMCLTWFAILVRAAQIVLVIGGLIGIGWLIVKIRGIKVDFWKDDD